MAIRAKICARVATGRVEEVGLDKSGHFLSGCSDMFSIVYFWSIVLTYRGVNDQWKCEPAVTRNLLGARDISREYDARDLIEFSPLDGIG